MQNRVVNACRRLVEHERFQAAVVALIALNAALVGVETSPALQARYGGLFAVANTVVVLLFVTELALRVIGRAQSLGAFLRDGWNLFDVTVVALSLLPGVGAFATIARIARVLRVARLVSVSPKLRLIVGTMMRSIPSLAHVSLLLGLLLYVYAVIGVNLFGAHDREHWGSLGAALLTLFQILTLEGWVEIQKTSMQARPWAWMYYGSFVIVAVFVVVNLFIAVVLNNLDEIREEDRRAALDEAVRLGTDDLFERHLASVRAELEQLEALYRHRRGLAPPASPTAPRGG